MLQDGPQLGHVKIMKFLRASSLEGLRVSTFTESPSLGTSPAHFIILANEADYGSYIDLTHQSTPWTRPQTPFSPKLK